MAKFCDVQKFKSAYYHRIGGQFDNAIHEMEKDEFCTDSVEREKIDKAIEEIKAESYSEHIDGADCDDILIVELRDVLEILKRHIGE